MKLGIGTYCYMWSIGFEGAAPARPMTAMDLLEKARELGVCVVQYGPNLNLLALPAGEVDRLAGQARDWGITLELATRGLEADHLLGQLALAKRIGSTLLRTIPEHGGQPTAAKDVPGHVRSVLPQFEAAGIRLGLENGKIPAALLGATIEELASPYLGVVLDTVNSLAVPEGYKEVTRELAPYTICLHYKPFVVRRVWSMMGFTVESRPAGQDQVDAAWLLETVKSAARAPFNVILELWPPEQKRLQETIDLEQAWAVESVRYLRQFIAD